ncbi:rRNA pseudouridine synthase [Leucobacter viscericola]|uniref:Pseudouridine synthase n=1 Tax=Leucobacter viscericola TaxID=2714935 RepID=A0A6G7XHV5_9MICO|nr:rRNA pseudouridine synthase [Leucobacter viscericola]
MNSSKEDFGGSFSVDGEDVEVDLAEFGWDRPSAASAKPEHNDDGRIRLQKALATAGVASRRACETLITSGRVEVNGEVQRELGSRINPETDTVRVDGVVVQMDVSKRYFVLNKPRGVVSTMRDEDGRPDLREFTDEIEDRLYNVGRLDTDTSGLLILTNDGELAHKLAHPSFGVQKTYVAKVRGRMTGEALQRLRDGVELKDGPIRADRAKLLPGGSSKTHSLIEVTLHSGRNRIVRRMLAEVGHPVEELVRRQFGPLHLGTLRVGEMRELSAGERGALLSAADEGGQDPEQSGGDDRGQDRGAQGGRQDRGRGAVTGGRPGDGKGARGMRGIAAKGNPHNRRGASGAGGGSQGRGGRNSDDGGYRGNPRQGGSR